MILLIDNYDSFTYNIAELVRVLGADLKIIKNDELSVNELLKLNIEKIIISSGTGLPKDAGISLESVEFFKDKKPILGIGLGCLIIAEAFGARLRKAKTLMHGKTSQIIQDERCPLFLELPKTFQVTRYHSLAIDKELVVDKIIPRAYSAEDDEIMAIEIKNLPIYGTLFNPEAYFSEHGKEILENFLRL